MAFTKLQFVIIGFLLYVAFKRVEGGFQNVDAGYKPEVGRYTVASIHYEHVSGVYTITLWILVGSLAKLAFHHSKALMSIFPESCLLILLGLVVGALFYGTGIADQKSYVLNSNTFMLFLLPPIILEAGYFMPNRPFFNNLGTILLFAIVNTLFNTICIGLTLYGFNFTGLYGGVDFNMLHCLLFAALISAVDPVAVLATFVEINVNDMLYIIVFGESLLNDAVSVVLYRLFDGFSEMGEENIQAVDVVLGCLSFLFVASCGVLIGILFGLIASFTTKFTEHTRVLEPLIVITYAYLSYLTAEMLSASGILAITFCGMFMKQYIEHNMGKKSNATVDYILKMLANIMETIIFMFMGLSTISDELSWNTGFVFMTIIACCLFRFLGVLLFANIVNRFRLIKLEFRDMLIMSYGGLRGAVAFALSLILDENKIPRKKEFVTATICVVYFTVFLQGTTIASLVKCLKIKRNDETEVKCFDQLTSSTIERLMMDIEIIAGVKGDNALREKVRSFDKKILKRLILREKDENTSAALISKLKKLTHGKMIEEMEKGGFSAAGGANNRSQNRVASNADINNKVTFSNNKNPKVTISNNNENYENVEQDEEDLKMKRSGRNARRNTVFPPSSKITKDNEFDETINDSFDESIQTDKSPIVPVKQVHTPKSPKSPKSAKSPKLKSALKKPKQFEQKPNPQSPEIADPIYANEQNPETIKPVHDNNLDTYENFDQFQNGTNETNQKPDKGPTKL